MLLLSHYYDLSRASSMFLAACWTLHTPSADVPFGYLTLVSFTVEGACVVEVAATSSNYYQQIQA